MEIIYFCQDFILKKYQAKKEIISVLQSEAKTEAMSIIQNTIDEAKLTANNEAKKISTFEKCLSFIALIKTIDI